METWNTTMAEFLNNICAKSYQPLAREYAKYALAVM